MLDINIINKKILSIDIGSQNIKIVEGVHRVKKVQVSKAITIKTPENTIQDGMITNMIAMKDELQQVLQKEKIKTKSVVFTTKSTNIITRIITIPMAKPSEMLSIVKYEMEQYLPINFEDYIIKYALLEKMKTEEGVKAKVRVIVYPKEMAENYLELTKGLKLQPLALDISSNCITKLFGNETKINFENYSPKGTVAVIDLGYDYLELTIISEGVTQFTRIISSGGNYIDIDIFSRLASEVQDAENEKIDLCEMDTEIYTDEHKEAINTSIKSVVDDWIREIYKLIEYYKNNNEGSNVDKIYLYGGSSRLKGIEKYMHDSLNMPIVVIKDIENIQFTGEKGEEETMNSYLNSVGSIIRL